MFVAVGTVIASFAIVKEGFFAHNRKVFENRSTVIMDSLCNKTAVRAGMRSPF